MARKIVKGRIKLTSYITFIYFLNIFLFRYASILLKRLKIVNTAGFGNVPTVRNLLAFKTGKYIFRRDLYLQTCSAKRLHIEEGPQKDGGTKSVRSN